jgi:hypothetical protein
LSRLCDGHVSECVSVCVCVFVFGTHSPRRHLLKIRAVWRSLMRNDVMVPPCAYIFATFIFRSPFLGLWASLATSCHSQPTSHCATAPRLSDASSAIDTDNERRALIFPTTDDTSQPKTTVLLMLYFRAGRGTFCQPAKRTAQCHQCISAISAIIFDRKHGCVDERHSPLAHHHLNPSNQPNPKSACTPDHNTRATNP